MTIRKAQSSDVQKLYALEQRLFSQENFPLSKGSFRYHIKNSLFFVTQIDYDLAGYILILIKRRDPKLYSIGVDVLWRGKKIADKLLARSIEELLALGFKTLLLEVRIDNVEALAFYKNRGFKIKKTLKAFYRDGCDAYLMELNMTQKGAN